VVHVGTDDDEAPVRLREDLEEPRAWEISNMSWSRFWRAETWSFWGSLLSAAEKTMLASSE
jgi:hypothetical protein